MGQILLTLTNPFSHFLRKGIVATLHLVVFLNAEPRVLISWLHIIVTLRELLAEAALRLLLLPRPIKVRLPRILVFLLLCQLTPSLGNLAHDLHHVPIAMLSAVDWFLLL